MKLPRFLTLTLVAVFISRIPSFFEPFYYGDEMIYLTLGNGIRRGLVLYKDIHDNKTPLIYFLAAVAGNVFWFRAILCFWMLATIILFWKLTKLLFPKKRSLQIIATIIFAFLTTIPTLEGQIANAELFMIAPTIGAIYLVIKNEKSNLMFFLGGLLISIATLFKVPAVFDAGVFFLLVTLNSKFTKNYFKEAFIKVILLLLGIVLPILLTFIWYALRGAFSEYLTAAFLQNIGYVASNRVGSIQNQIPLITKLTPILIRGSIVFVGFVILFITKKKLGKPFILGSAWVLTSLFAATLSERPYPHYLIQVVPAISILLAILLSARLKEQALAVIPIAIVLLAAVNYNFWYYSPVPYFGHVVTFFNKNSNEEYLNSFSSEVPRNYEIAAEIEATTKESDKVLVLGDSPPIYALSRRLPPIKYVAGYHINDYSSEDEVLNKISKDKPYLVVVLPNENVQTSTFLFIRQYYRQLKEIDGAKFWYNISK